ncbi:aspartate 1-decarboxylase [bacterium]|nr:aspartate 1-decarboxylase [bacterium]
MHFEALKSKIHRAAVTEADINYVGSVTIDESLMDAVGLIEFEKVHVLNITNGLRAETYVIRGERGSRAIIMNGALARLAQVGDRVIILAYGFFDEKEIKEHHPRIVILNEHNEIVTDNR